METRSAEQARCPHCGAETKNAHGLAVHVGREHGWPACGDPECDRPAKRSSYGTPRKHCPKHQKRRETEANRASGPCAAPGCDLPRRQALALCKWHSTHGPEAQMDEATRRRSDRARARWEVAA